jgi:NAD(P)-dependent dehydrogenase (short-subunit alcohol dehydrogenase family)
MTKRWFLVTGASKGIGRAISERFAAEGHAVVGIARTPDPTFPGELVSIDLADRDRAGNAIAELAQEYRFDGLINNFGTVRMHRVGDIKLSELDDILETNIYPVVQATQAVLPGMKDRGFGRIINISSLTVIGIAGRSAYAAAKSAVNSLTRTWAIELAEAGVTVNAVAPGPIETALFRKNTPTGSDAEKRFLGLIPMRRLGQPDEVAAAVSYLASDAAGYVTGQTLFVDVGGSIGRSPI